MPESKSKTESEKDLKSKREPRALSNEYHKARKQLMLWSAILFIWELVGIDLEKAKEAGGNAGAIIGALKSPQAVPWALLILVLYFSFKLRVEWRQCNMARRAVFEAKQDYYSAFLVAFGACALYFGQAISRVQFANAVQGSRKVESLGSGFFLIFFLFIIISVFWKRRWLRFEVPEYFVVISTAAMSLGASLYLWQSSGGANRWSLAGSGLGLLMLALSRAFLSFLKRKGFFPEEEPYKSDGWF